MFDPVPVLEKIVASLDRDAREPTKLRGLLVPELRKVIETGHADAERLLLRERDGLACAQRLSRLTDAEREFLMMRYEMGLSNHEVAQMLGKSPGSVSARYSRLLKKCRNLCMEGRR